MCPVADTLTLWPHALLALRKKLGDFCKSQHDLTPNAVSKGEIWIKRNINKQVPIPGTLNNQFEIDVWLNNHFLCNYRFGIIQLKQPFINGCLGFQVWINFKLLQITNQWGVFNEVLPNSFLDEHLWCQELINMYGHGINDKATQLWQWGQWKPLFWSFVNL